VLGDQNALIVTEKEPSVANVPFRELVGALLFLSRNTRPDISFAVNFISRFNDCFQEKHWKAAKRILRYLQGSKQLCLTYHSQEPDFFGYCDSDWAQDRSDRKSTTGYVFFFAGAPISWATKKQQSVALSTCEAEYMAMSEATKEAMYLRQLLQDINMLPQPAPTIIYCDNQAAIQLTKTESQHNRAKHIDIRHHFVRDAIRRKIVTFKYVNSENNTADILTKAIPTPQHQKLVKQLNLKVKSASSSGGNMDPNTRR
jgi:hypothetical protein